MDKRTITPLSRGTSVSRFVRALSLAQGNTMRAAEIAAPWLDTPGVKMALRTTVTAMDSSAALDQYGISKQWIELERQFSVIGRLFPQLRRVPFKVKVPTADVGAATSTWVAEASPVPAIEAVTAAVALDHFKAGKIIVVTRELVEKSTPTAEAVLSRILTSSVARFLDSEFFDPSVTESAGLNPASICNGATQVTSTGTSAAQISTDLASMIDALSSWVSPIWCMSPWTAAKILATGAASFPGLRANGGTLLGLDVITGASVPAGLIVLLDRDQILIADDGDVSINFSDTAMVNSETSPVSETNLVSLWQWNLTGVRVTRFVAWKRASDTAVVYLQVTFS